ncbi:MAG TPA: helix-turn-helix domain-containing protein [Streptomyces sp.]|nr:helix-turn-helix domain-containing protein [Streptomyces sp.]
MEVTVSAPHTPADTDVCDVREVLDLMADKWSLYVVSNLSEGPRRFNELKRAVHGVSQRMLTVTLRRLERDGILTRTVHEVMPLHVTYQLTPLGTGLLHAAGPLITWSTGHLAEIAAARAGHDRSRGLDAQTTGA